MAHEAALHWVWILALGTVLVGVCQHFRLSPILGYLAAGTLVGPEVFGWVHDAESISTLAEIGVVLLMFTIGLEFSLPKLLASKRLVLGLGGAQVVVTALVIGLLAAFLGVTLVEALVVGLALAMSSTAIVLKQLGEQMELPTVHGRAVTAVLLFQDIAAVPILVVLPVLAADPSALSVSLAVALSKAVVVFTGLMLAGRYLLPPLLHWIAATRSLELFMLTALLLALAAAAFSFAAGLSPTLGAFMAGMLLGETEFRHQVEADIRPFRDLMLGLFFVSIGLQLDPGVFVEAPVAVLLVLVVLVLIKPIVLAPMVRALNHGWLDSTRTAVALAQGGEFGLLVVSTAFGLGLIAPSLAQPVLGGIILSMVLAPLMVRFNQPIAQMLVGQSMPTTQHLLEAELEEMSRGMERPVIVCGYGRLGQNVMRLLEAEGIDALALDLDAERVRQASSVGGNVIFGNATQPGVLRAAGLDRAHALALTMRDVHSALGVIRQARAMGFSGPILVRSLHGRDDAAFVEAGATVFPEGLEVSLAFVGQLLIMLDLPPSKVDELLNAIRADDYAPLRVFFHDSSADAVSVENLDYQCQARSCVVRDHYRQVIGRTPSELGLEKLGVKVAGVQRGPIRLPGDASDLRLRAGDVLLLEGTPEALEKAVAEIRSQ